MKTMIEVKKLSEGRTFWIALDSITCITSEEGYCKIWAGKTYYDYPDSIEHLAQATRSAADVRGEMRLIGLEDSHD